MNTYSLTSDDLRVLAFVRDWSPEREGATALELLRLRVMEVGVELIVIGANGVWVFGTDGRIGHVDRLAGNIATSATIYAARRGDAAFLIDDGTVIRIAHDGSLADAVTGAAELLAMRAKVIEGAQDTTLPGGYPAAVDVVPSYIEVAS